MKDLYNVMHTREKNTPERNREREKTPSGKWKWANLKGAEYLTRFCWGIAHSGKYRRILLKLLISEHALVSFRLFQVDVDPNKIASNGWRVFRIFFWKFCRFLLTIVFWIGFFSFNDFVFSLVVVGLSLSNENNIYSFRQLCAKKLEPLPTKAKKTHFFHSFDFIDKGKLDFQIQNTTQNET